MEPPSDRVLGLDVGGTRCAASIGDAGGGILQRIEWPSHPDRGADAMIDDIVLRAKELLAGEPSIAACGIAIGGPLDAQTGVVKGPPNLPGWDDVQLKSILQRALGIPTRVEPGRQPTTSGRPTKRCRSRARPTMSSPTASFCCGGPPCRPRHNSPQLLPDAARLRPGRASTLVLNRA